MSEVLVPGVYIREAPPTIRPVAQVATSIAVFIDYFSEGPMNQAIDVFGLADFERVFGGLDRLSEGSYAITQFFLNGGTHAIVIRVAGTDAGVPAIAAKSHVLNKSGGTVVLGLAAANAGAWGNNLRFAIEPTDDPSSFNVSIVRYADATKAPPIAIANERHVNLSMDPNSPRYCKSVLAAKSLLVHPILVTGLDIPPPVGTIGAGVTAAPLTLNSKDLTFTLGTTGGEKITLSTSGTTTLANVRDAISAALRTQAGLGGIDVQLVTDPTSTTTPKAKRLWFRNTRRDRAFNPKDTITVAGSAISGLGLSSPSVNIQEYVFGTTAAVGAQAVSTPDSATGGDIGTNGVPPTASDIIGQRAAQTGLYALERADLFNIVCVPGAALLDTPGKMDEVYSEIIAYAQERRAFVLVDAGSDVGADAVRGPRDFMDAHAQLRSDNSAFYFPDVRIPDPLDDYRLSDRGASGTIAGLYAATDAKFGVWKTPAGIEAVLRGVPELAVKLTDGQQGALNPLGINCLRNFPIYGNVCWGGRSLNGADAMASPWKYVAIRRLALMIEESLFRGTKWVVFEPNDEPLWSRIRLNVGNFMMGLFRQGAFQGDTPSKAFFVKCDGETTTANDRNLGIVNIQVGFAPLKPAEFVVITIQQIPDVDQG
jgi:phage tail sheath protein FI